MTWGWALVRPVPITAAMLAPANPRVDYPRYSTPADWNMGVTGNDIDGSKSTVAAVGSESTLATGYPASLTQTARNALKTPALAAPSDIGKDYGAYSGQTGRAGYTAPLDPYSDATSPTKLTSVVPGTGTTAGGATVTLAGVGFTGATAVTFGGTAGTSIVVGTPNSLTVVTPAKAAGSYDVLVTSPKGTSQAGVKYTYA